MAESVYGFNGQEKDDEISGSGNSYTAEFWQYDSRLGRRWNQDPKPNPSISNYATFANNPIWFSDPLGDTTYRFNLKGHYLGAFDLDQDGIKGFYGSSKTYKDENGNNVEQWNGTYFEFNDREVDKWQFEAMQVGDKMLQIVSDEEINDIMQSSGIEKKGFIGRWYFSATESGREGSGKMDFGPSYLGGNPGGGQNDFYGGFFIFGNQKKAFNPMDGGNWLWGQGMKRLGFDYSSAKQGAEANEWWNDPEGDQRAIKSGFHYNVKSQKVAPFKLKIEECIE